MRPDLHATRAPYALVLLAAAALLLLPAIAGAQASGEPANPPNYGKDYASSTLSGVALSALLWEACPDDLRAPCLVDDPKTEHGEAFLNAPPAVHRTVARQLAALDGGPITRHLRIDLVRHGGTGGNLPPSLPGTVRRALDAYQGELPSHGLVHLGTWRVATSDAATGLLATPEGLFRLDVNLKGPVPPEGRPVRLYLGLSNQGIGSDPGIIGRTFQSELQLAPGEAVLAGTSVAHADGETLAVFATLAP